MGDFKQYGRARHGWVGVNVVEAPDTGHDGRTVRVVQAVPGTPASKSGILPGDTVMRIDAREIYRPADVLDASFFSQVGGTMTVVVRRDDKLFNYNFAVIERPQIPAADHARSRSTRMAEPGQPIRRQSATGAEIRVARNLARRQESVTVGHGVAERPHAPPSLGGEGASSPTSQPKATRTAGPFRLARRLFSGAWPPPATRPRAATTGPANR